MDYADDDDDDDDDVEDSDNDEEDEDEERLGRPLKLPFAGQPGAPRLETSTNSQIMESLSEARAMAASVTMQQQQQHGTDVDNNAQRPVERNAAERHGTAGAELDGNAAAVAAAAQRQQVSTLEQHRQRNSMSPPPAELKDETMLDKEHKSTLAKLTFVGQLVDSLCQIAAARASPLSLMLQSRRSEPHDAGGNGAQGGVNAQLSQAYRRVEQLVVYVRALHMLSSALQLAQSEVAARRLLPTATVRNVLNALSERYQTCLARAQELASAGLPAADRSLSLVSAERLMYDHALELCQSAALDELFGKPHACSRRYQTAHALLHCLAQQASHEDDRALLEKYKDAVEKRLRILEKQGYVSIVQDF